MITEAKLHLAQAAATLLQDEVMKPRGSAERRLRPRDLLQFGRCPARWVRGADADDALAAYGPTLTEWLAYEPKLAERHYVRRPDTYEAMVLRCPNCNSASLAQTCTKCGVRRRNVVEPRTWTSAAKHCADWNAKHESAGLRIVTGGEWDRATLGAANVRADRAIAGLAEESDALVLFTGTWHDEET